VLLLFGWLLIVRVSWIMFAFWHLTLSLLSGGVFIPRHSHIHKYINVWPMEVMYV